MNMEFDDEASYHENQADHCKSNKKEVEQYRGHTILSCGDPLDDSTLYGSLKLVTLESAQLCIRLVADFIREEEENVSFIRSVFDPLWQRLKNQGSEVGLNWKYEQNRNSLSTRNWCFVPPCSTLGTKGIQGEDFFVTEEEVVLSVLHEVKSLNERSEVPFI